MPWWGFALSAVFIWLMGLITGRALGRSEVLQQMMAQQAMSSQAMNPLMGMAQRAGNASERQA
jgi:hypothetical protein